MTTISKTLSAGETYPYNGGRTLDAAGNWNFFAAYQETNGHWTSFVPALSGVVRSRPITATNPPTTISVTVQTNVSGRSFSVDGTNYSSAQTFTWTSGSSHTISTTSPQSGGTGTQYVWSNWSDGGAISHSVAPTNNVTYTANFTTQYQLTTSAGTGGTVSPSSGNFYNAGQGVQIQATPNSGYTFSGWAGSGNGSYSGSNNPANITMNGPITETATFTQTPVDVPVTVGTNPVGRSFTVDGTTYTSTKQLNWKSDEAHTIGVSSPQSGGTGIQYVWSNWSDGGAISHTVSAYDERRCRRYG